MTTPPAAWLQVGDVKRWLHLTGAADDDLLAQVVGAVQVEVARYRPDVPVPASGDEVYQGAVMYAGRVYRRRNSPAGTEGFGDSVSYVARWDPDVDRFLRRGNHQLPSVG